MRGGCTTRIIDARRLPIIEEVGEDGHIEARIVDLEREAIATLDERFDGLVPLAQSTRGGRDALSTTGWAETMQSYFYATAAISAPGTPDLLHGIPHVRHDFS
jgi:hypothetical protein